MFLFDLDGTVTREELLPRIAESFGVLDEIKALTQRTIAGDVPFESSLRARVSILGGFPVSSVQDVVAGVELERCILSFMAENPGRCAVVTGNLDAWLAKLERMIPAPVHCTQVVVKGDRVSGFIDIMDKRRVRELYPNHRLCAVGDGHNDLGMFEVSDYAIAFGGVHSPARSLLEAASHVTYSADTLCRFLSQL